MNLKTITAYTELIEIRNKTLTTPSDDVSLQDILQMLQYRKRADDWNGEEYNLFIDMYVLEINGNIGVDNIVFYDLSKPTSEQKQENIENIIKLLK